MLVNPFLKMTYTFRAPHRRADVQQSKAVSPHPRTITFPNKSGNLVLQEQVMPTTKWVFRTINDSSNKGTINTYHETGGLQTGKRNFSATLYTFYSTFYSAFSPLNAVTSQGF